MLSNAKKVAFFAPSPVVFKSDELSQFLSEFALRFVAFVKSLMRKVVATAFFAEIFSLGNLI